MIPQNYAIILQEELARAASVTSTDQSQQTSTTQQPAATSHGVGGAVNRPAQTVKAFSGKGHSLMDTSPSRLVTLQSRERELQTQVRALNRQLVHAEANKDVSLINSYDQVLSESNILFKVIL